MIHSNAGPAPKLAGAVVVTSGGKGYADGAGSNWTGHSPGPKWLYEALAAGDSILKGCQLDLCEEGCNCSQTTEHQTRLTGDKLLTAKHALTQRHFNDLAIVAFEKQIRTLLTNLVAAGADFLSLRA